MPSLPELLSRVLGCVQPRLPVIPVLEPAVGATNGQVEDQVEFLIERGVIPASLGPGVDEGCSVGVCRREPASLPHWLCEGSVHDHHKAVVDICEEVLLRPLKTKGVEAI